MNINPILFGHIQHLQNQTWQQDLLRFISHFDFHIVKLNIESLPNIIACAAILLFFLSLMFNEFQRKLRHEINSNNGIDPEEFDYLSSDEAIPAKFNLAEAYIQMNDLESATKVLSEIIAKGNQSQREQALKTLDDIS